MNRRRLILMCDEGGRGRRADLLRGGGGARDLLRRRWGGRRKARFAVGESEFLGLGPFIVHDPKQRMGIVFGFPRLEIV